MNYIYPHSIWARMCIPRFFDYDSIPMTFYYTCIYFKAPGNIRLGFRYLCGYLHGFEIRKCTVASFPLSNFQVANLNLW